MSFESWLEERANHEDDPLRLEQGTAWKARNLTKQYNEQHEDTLSVHEVAGKLTWLRDNDHWYDFDVERSWITKAGVAAWVITS